MPGLDPGIHLQGMVGPAQVAQALAVLLMDRDGRVAAQAGNLPADSDSLQAALKASLDAGVKISWAMGKLPPEDLTYFSGINYDLYLVHVGQSALKGAMKCP